MKASPRGVREWTKPQAWRWRDGLPDVTAELHCGGQRHRIVWHRGKLVLADHDLPAERSLTALGCEPPLCVEVLDAWCLLRGPELLHAFLARRDSAERVEDLASRRIEHAEAIERARSLAAGPGQVLRGLMASAPQLIERERRAWAMTLLEALPVDFRRMLVLAMIVEMQRRWHDAEYRSAHREHVEPALDAMASRLVERSARCCSTSLKRYARFDVEAHVLAPGEPPQCSVRFDDHGGAGRLAMSLSWFTDVWSRGFALVDEVFVCRCTGPAADLATLPVVALRWEQDRRKAWNAVEAPAVVSRDEDGALSLRWL